MPKALRYAKRSGLTIANAIFMLAFFGSWAVLPRLGVRWELPWILLIIAWAISIRWWIVAGLFTGLILRPVQLHVFDVEGPIRYAGAGAIIGLIAEIFWDEIRPPTKQPIDTSSGVQ